jgi:hypothetical protein
MASGTFFVKKPLENTLNTMLKMSKNCPKCTLFGVFKIFSFGKGAC